MEPVPNVPGLTLGERLGQGSYATVFKATNKVCRSDGTREVFAVKCILKSKINVTQTSQDNLIREIEILKTLRHRHIVKLIDFTWDENYIYLILEYCNAGDLSKFIQRQQRAFLPEPVSRKFLQQLASAIRYLRLKEISHMDLKPQNILLMTDKNGLKLKLADFGFARVLRPGDFATSFRGSPLYMAPEILTRKFYDARVDLWSIGVIMYQCLFGKAPFASPTIDELVDRIVSDEPIQIPATPPVSDSCKDLVLSLLQRDPNVRLQFDEFFTHPFVDLEHAPSEECLKKAKDYLSRATRADDERLYKNAIDLYCKALDYYLLAIQYSEDPDEKLTLREYVRRILARGEELKRLNRPDSARRFKSDSPDSSFTMVDSPRTDSATLRSVWSNVPQVDALLVLISFADNLIDQQKHEEALDKYQLGIETALQIISKEPKSSERADVLKRYVHKWLSTAEHLQIYVEAKKLNASIVEAKECDALAVEEKTKSLVQENMCRLQ